MYYLSKTNTQIFHVVCGRPSTNGRRRRLAANHHPGGAEIIENYRGRDATDVFMVMHSEEAVAKLKRLAAGHACRSTDPPG